MRCRMRQQQIQPIIMLMYPRAKATTTTTKAATTTLLHNENVAQSFVAIAIGQSTALCR